MLDQTKCLEFCLPANRGVVVYAHLDNVLCIGALIHCERNNECEHEIFDFHLGF
jgi:hypothetical protein